MASELRVKREGDAVVIEKKYLTFEELQERWKCGKSDIHYLVAESELVPSIAWNGNSYCCNWEPGIKSGSSRLVVSQDSVSFDDVEQWISGWVYLRLPTQLGPIEKYSFSYATQDISPKNEHFCEGVWFKLIDFDKRTVNISAVDLEINAVFTIFQIETCEVFNPDLLLGTANKTLESSISTNGGSVILVEGDKISAAHAEGVPNPRSQIYGPTYNRLRRAVTAFPDAFQDYQRSKLLKKTIEAWLLDSDIAITTREAKVFTLVIVEHFQLSSDN